MAVLAQPVGNCWCSLFLGSVKAEDGLHEKCIIIENKWFRNLRIMGSRDWKPKVQKGDKNRSKQWIWLKD